MTNTSFTTNNWERLLKRIAEKTVIPIIGNEMYQFEQNGKLTHTDEYLARQLMGKFDVTEPAINTIAAAVDHLVENENQNLNDVTDTLKDLSENLPFTFPLIDKLLSINAFSFYTNTAVYTKLFEQKIEKVRQQAPVSISYSIESLFDDCDMATLTKPHVFNVFGSLSNELDAAITEEEMLEFTASFQERMNKYAVKILDALKTKTLLFLGCSNPEWMMRFFMRVLSNQRMYDWPRRKSNIIVVNNESENREKQFELLNNYNTLTYPGSTGGFVNELADRWTQFPDKGKPKMVFLSYTQKDVVAVENLIKAISGINNLQYWYDKEKLFSGDNYEIDITENIKNADIFIPLISENSISQPDKYVLREWERAHVFNIVKADKNNKYLMPIVIDKADLTNSTVTKYYQNMSIEQVPDGNAGEAFLNQLKLNLNLL